jgi:arylsulfatase A-like enzyme
LDQYIGELLELLPSDATVLVVSDHGMAPLTDAGYHAPYGIFIGSGPRIKTGVAIRGASVLDIAPTLLHLFEAPIPLDMDGKVLPYVFESSWLEKHLPRYADIDTTRTTNAQAQKEGTEQELEDLRALGYIQ